VDTLTLGSPASAESLAETAEKIEWNKSTGESSGLSDRAIDLSLKLDAESKEVRAATF
jgi:hypothetical protein